ncbi:MAG: mechanosensitive ion channel family protein [Clostridia bacterium]|nr:mechanosensitive ion channel family protein [Clostridia bacterium]
MDWNAILNSIVNWAVTTGIKIVISLIVLLVSYRIVDLLARRIRKKLEQKEKIDKTLLKILINAGKIALKCLIAVCLVNYLGINTGALTALVTSLGVCVGLAVNGALGNIAGGILLLVTRPFKVDDFIELSGHTGTVEDIRLCNTKIRTVDNKVVYIPNGIASTNPVVNYTEKDLRRLDIDFTVSYETDTDKAKEIITAVLDGEPMVEREPAPTVQITSYDSSAITICCRPWVKGADYWTLRFLLLDKIKKEFDRSGIRIPFNQLDVHLRTDKE